MQVVLLTQMNLVLLCVCVNRNYYIVCHIISKSVKTVQVAIELVKVIKNAPIEHYKNAFLNLALPLFVFSEPAPAIKTTMRLYICQCFSLSILVHSKPPAIGASHL